MICKLKAILGCTVLSGCATVHTYFDAPDRMETMFVTPQGQTVALQVDHCGGTATRILVCDIAGSP